MTGVSSEVVITSVFMALEGAFAYSAFLPSIMTIGTFVDSQEKITMIRQGEVVGTAFLVALAFTVAAVMKSPLPLVFSLVAGGATLGIYEYALRQSPAWNQAAAA
jgi:inactivated superfamily I helicase